MALKVSKPKIQEFELKEVDEKYGCEGDPTKITVRQATQQEVELREGLNEKISRIFSLNEDTMEVKGGAQISQKKRIETYLVLSSCNILDSEGNPFFKFKEENGISKVDMSEHEFRVRWGKLPSDVCDAIYKRVVEVNPMWSLPTL